MNKFFKVLRYRFDNSIVKPGVFILYALATLVFLSVFDTLLSIWVHAGPLGGATNPNDFWEQLYERLWLTLGKEYASHNWADRIERFATWVTNIGINALVFGFAASSITTIVQRIRAGNSIVVVSGHTLILGWSSQVFSILKELANASESGKRGTVVIFSSKSRQFMEQEIASRAGNLGKLRVVTRQGDTTNPSDINRASARNSKAIIALDSPEASGQAGVVTKVLAVRKVLDGLKVPIVAEIDDPHLAKALEEATLGEVQIVGTQGIVARVTAQSCRQPGLSNVVLDLLDFTGNEIYFTDGSELAGMTYRDALQSFDQNSVIGISDSHRGVWLNPPPTVVIAAGAKVLVLAEDDDKVKFTGIKQVQAPSFKKPELKPLPPQHILVMGWSAMGKNVVTELSGFLPKGSTLNILATSAYVAPGEFEALQHKNINVTFTESKGLAQEIIAAAELKNYDQVLLLGYRDGLSESEADALTLLSLVQIKALFHSSRFSGKAPRVIAELLDSRKVDIAQIDQDDDLVVSDDIAALLVSQTTENAELSKVFEELFDAEGASLNMRAVEHFAPLGAPVSFAELVAAGADASDSVIGYRTAAASRDGTSHVRLNPPKWEQFTPAPGDSLIVVGNN